MKLCRLQPKEAVISELLCTYQAFHSCSLSICSQVLFGASKPFGNLFDFGVPAPLQHILFLFV